MKILELRLAAFGPFSGRTIDLSGGNHGLHVIFGPNEAGKSSALRALHALLYGIPVQTDDAFVHPYPELRVGARLRHSSGDEIEFSRRKANKGSLLGLGDARLADNALDRFLGGVGPDQFRMFWGIDHGRLVEGGREILEGRGDLGASLFAAGTGASRLGALRKRLDEEAAELFAPRGHNRPINQAVNGIRDLRREQRDTTVSAEEWARQDGAVGGAVVTIRKLTGDALVLAREKARLERAKRVLPLLAERGELRSRLAGLADVVRLAPDFPQRRIEAEAALRNAERHRERAAAGALEQSGVVKSLGATPPLAGETEAVTQLHESLGSHRRALRDRPRLIGQRGEQRELAKRLLAEMRPDLNIDSAEPLRVFAGRRARIQKLVGERERLEVRLETARETSKAADKRVDALGRESKSLPPARDSESLVAAIEEARRRGDTEAGGLMLRHSLERSTGQRDALIAKLRLPAAELEELAELNVPTAAAIARFERRALEIENDARTAKGDRQRLVKATGGLKSKIDTAHTKRSVPTKDDLDRARSRRDAAFGLLRDHWVAGRDVVAEARDLLGEGELIELYPGAVTSADEVADRLRDEADRVAELAQQIEEHDRLSKELKETERAEEALARATVDLDVDWRGAWKSVLDEPPPVHDARAWCEDFGRLVELVDEVVEAQRQHADLAAWVEKQTKDLSTAIHALEPALPPPSGLSVAVNTADRLRQRIEKDARRLEDHARETRETADAIRDADTAIKAAQGELDEWQGRWNSATQGLVQGDTAAPDDALVALDRIDKIFRALDEAAGFEARIAGIDRDAEKFQGEVRALAERLGDTASIRDGNEDTWVEGLHKRIAVVIQEDERRRQSSARLKELERDVAADDIAIKGARDAILILREEADCGADADLVLLEQRSEEARKCEGDIDRVERELLRNGEGASIVEIAAESDGIDKDGIDPRLKAIGVELLEIETALTVARDAKAGAQAELARIAGPSVASEKAEEMQATLARLRDDVLRYSRLRVAGTLLARRIDDYRRQNQAPLLLRAGALFREMTLGGFERLEADVEDDRPILVGLRSTDGRRVPAHGMSEGTRDQLFFALRLAAVEASCAAGEPMPLVVDDVLVQFDDDRGAAALRVLADVSSRTQVVLFTHHRHVRNEAVLLAESADVRVYDI